VDEVPLILADVFQEIAFSIEREIDGKT